MAEKKCPDCKMMIDAAAKICPHCRKKFRTSFCVKLLTVLIILIALGMFTSRIKSTPTISTVRPVAPAQTPEQRAKEAKQARFDLARRECKHVLMDRLHDPGSADLNYTYEWFARENTDGTILVQPSGRAKNAFGAYIKGVWNCTARVRGETIQVLSLKQIQP